MEPTERELTEAELNALSDRLRRQRVRRDPDGIALRTAPVGTTAMKPKIEREGGKFGAGYITGVSLAETGPAMGHGFDLDDVTIDQIATLGASNAKGVQSHFNHPDMCNPGLGNGIGRVFDFSKRTDSDGKTRSYGDLHFFKSADTAKVNHVMGLAEESPESLGMSVALTGKIVKRVDPKTSEPLKDASGKELAPVFRIDRLRAADVVHAPAANTRGMFGGNLGAGDVGVAASAAFDDAFAMLGKVDGSNAEAMFASLAAAEPIADLIQTLKRADASAGELLSSEDGLTRVADFVTTQLHRRGIDVSVSNAVLQRFLNGSEKEFQMDPNKDGKDGGGAPDTSNKAPKTNIAALATVIATALAAAGFDSADAAKPAETVKDQNAALNERKRILDIQALAEAFPADAEAIAPILTEAIDKQTPLTEVQASVLKKLQANQPKVPTAGVVAVGQEARVKFSDAAVDAILVRGQCLTDAKDQSPENRKRYDAAVNSGLVGMGAKRLAAKCLALAGVRDYADLDDEALYFRAMNLHQVGGAYQGDIHRGVRLASAYAHGTSDFPLILANAGNKSLLAGWETAMTTWDIWARIGNLNDFKTATRLRLSESGLFDERPEGTPAQEGTFNERGEDIFLKNFAKAFSYTRQMFLNDDLGAFSDLGRRYGNGGAMTIEVTVYDNLLSNAGVGPTMSDSNALFHALHKNLNSGGAGAPTQANLEEMANAMMIQQGIGEDGASIPAGAPPKYFLAKPMIASSIDSLIHAPFRGTAGLEQPQDKVLRTALAIPVPYLGVKAENDWYGVADQNAAPSYEVAFLNGVKTMRTKVVVGTTVDGVKVVVDFDFNVGPTGGWEGINRNAGA